jgi:hypothetical protein
MKRKTLDIQKIKRLHKFGKLKVCEVQIFNHLRFQIVTVLRTLDEEMARSRQEIEKEHGWNTVISTYWVNFDDAFLTR